MNKLEVLQGIKESFQTDYYKTGNYLIVMYHFFQIDSIEKLKPLLEDLEEKNAWVCDSHITIEFDFEILTEILDIESQEEINSFFELIGVENKYG